ncbi:hypothetical protein DICPUDRAFT_35950 [Dictyostelium purpureum]|uniref:THH1/TOM1/TOM3 domain-containing protein n=1 Tax=Dictyostelium purpureum TaxID=5786 RepID=F0ZQ71_DICPU|nr:uncharacterized protein DICPUDRAFT_35950 [Dictyostelium purpureum]EGC33932.1 hypothetical protein DICPUDRAFT_35950 [Dictyostelium purpureum]|eukprot:XP_003289567.1 hypothetical protein DICPUDRAFT_35950 [Dictyostelium purpureum]
MGFHAVSHSEFTTSDPVNKAVLGLSIVRLFLFLCIFLVNLNQSIHEFLEAKKKKKYINPRLFTFVSITIYPFTRLFMIGVFFYDKTIDNGSITVAVSIWGTLFQYLEWTFICVFWSTLLYTYFIKKDIILKNTRRVWIGASVITVVLFIWTIVQTILNFYLLDAMNASYGPGQIVIVVGIGGFYLVNGIILARAIKKNGSKIPMLEESFNRIKKMAAVLLVMVVGVFLVFIIQVPVLGLEDYDTANYAFYLVQCLLEFTQLSVVMYSLGGDSFKTYFRFGRAGNTNSSKFSANSGNSSSNAEKTFEINLNEIAGDKHYNLNNTASTNSLQTITPTQSTSNLNTSLTISHSHINFNNDSTQNLSISVSIDQNNDSNV